MKNSFKIMFGALALSLAFGSAGLLALDADMSVNTKTTDAGGSAKTALNTGADTKAAVKADMKAKEKKAYDSTREKAADVKGKVNASVDSRVEAAIAGNSQIAGTDVKAKVNNGEVTLKGKVQTEAQKASAEQSARAVTGVTSVKNEIKVEGARKKGWWN